MRATSNGLQDTRALKLQQVRTTRHVVRATEKRASAVFDVDVAQGRNTETLLPLPFRLESAEAARR